MILPYFSRLICLAFACSFLVHLLTAALMNCLAPAAIRFARVVRAREAARMFFVLRLFPLALTVLLVTGFCVPSYLRLEPDETTEPIGLACLAAAFFGFWSCAEAMVRGVHALLASRRYIRRCSELGRPTQIDGDGEPVCVVHEAAPVIAVAGLIRPTLIASSRVIRVLSAEQISAALGHERAHWAAHDNLKRLFFRFAPRVLPLVHGFRRIERGWSRFTEWAADDRAVAGDPTRSVVLAATLVLVARISSAREPSPVTSSLLANGEDLSARVNRLLSATDQNEKNTLGVAALGVSAVAALAVALTAAIAYPDTLQIVHGLLEFLIQ